MRRILRIGAFGLALTHPVTTTAAEVATPSTLSPGEIARFAATGSACPTFSWAPPRAILADRESSVRYILKVWREVEVGAEVEQLLQIEIPFGATSWTPSLERCFQPSQRLIWSIGVGESDDEMRWAEPRLFSTGYAADAAASVRAGTKPPPGSEVDPSSAGESRHRVLSRAADELAIPRAQSPRAVSGTFSVDSAGGVWATSFTGSGAGVTDVVAADLACTNCIGSTEANTDQLQRRVTGTCVGNSSIRQINPDGTVVCDPDDTVLLGSTYSASATNGGEQLTGGPAVASSICYLSKVAAQDLDNGSELGLCSVTQFGVNWLLTADVTDGRDGDVECEMTCFSF